MLFAHDTEVALASAAALVNSGGPDADLLDDPAAFRAFLDEWHWSGERTGGAAERKAVRALRGRLRGFWEQGEDAVAALVNEMLADGGALPQLVTHGGWGYHLHATPPDAPLVDRMAVEAAMAVVDVVRQGELERLRVCEADGCAQVLVDLSKNRSRRFCSTACGNRTHVAAFRARRSPG